MKQTLIMLTVVTLAVFIAAALFKNVFAAWDTFIAVLLASIALAQVVVFFFIKMFGWPKITRVRGNE